MSILWWRLPKRAIDKLTLPALPEGYYFVVQKNGRLQVRRRTSIWPFHATVDYELASMQAGSTLVAKYNSALVRLASAAKKEANRRYSKENFMKGLLDG